MPGRNDFAIIRSALLTDDRAHAVAEEYARRGWAHEHLALSTVVGHVAMLGLWIARETDDGILPGDGVTAMCAATMMPRSVARDVLTVLRSNGLIRDEEGGAYVCGFRDCYSSLFERRAKNREQAAEARAKARAAKVEKEAKAASRRQGKPVSATSAPRGDDVRATSAPHHADVAPHSARAESEPCRAVLCSSPPSPSPGESEGPAAPNDPQPVEGDPPGEGPALRRRERERFGRVVEYVVRCGAADDRTAALELRRRHRANQVPDAEIAELLAGRLAWVTRERLARWQDAAPGPRGDDHAVEPPTAPQTAPSSPAAAPCARHGRPAPCSVCAATATPPASPDVAQAALDAIRGRLGRPASPLAAEAMAIGHVAPMPDAEREAIRLGQRLADIPLADSRHAAATALLAERPRGASWTQRAARLLASDVPEPAAVVNPFEGFEDVP